MIKNAQETADEKARYAASNTAQPGCCSLMFFLHAGQGDAFVPSLHAPQGEEGRNCLLETT